MSILDTNVAIGLRGKNQRITDDITIVTLAEYPPIMDYSGFEGRVIYPESEDLDLVVELQEKLRAKGKAKGFADLLIAAICINRNEELHTLDIDFEDICGISNLKVKER